jgi:hypothetical protein
MVPKHLVSLHLYDPQRIDRRTSHENDKSTAARMVMMGRAKTAQRRKTTRTTTISYGKMMKTMMTMILIPAKTVGPNRRNSNQVAFASRSKVRVRITIMMMRVSTRIGTVVICPVWIPKRYRGAAKDNDVIPKMMLEMMKAAMIKAVIWRVMLSLTVVSAHQHRSSKRISTR